MDELVVLGTMGEDYKLSLMDSHRMGRILKAWIGKDLEITIKGFKRQRSLAQNRWMWGVCVPTVQAWLKETQGISYTKDEVYYYINSAALRRKTVVKEIAGEEVVILEGKRFSQQTTGEFSDSVEEIVQYFGERGLKIPLPKPKTNNLISDYLKDE